ncbi:nonstructural protein [Microviridae sp.]|nr:nonstructural protein [Microviridae sp.]
MNINVYAIYDKKAAAHMPPFFLHNDNLAIRAVMSTLMNEGMLVDHPEDFVLNRLAVFDDNLGTFEPDPAVIITIQQLKNEMENVT